MIDSNAFLGLPLKFKSICKVYPPKIQDILTEENYSVYRKLFLTTQEDIEDEFAENKLSMTDIPDPMDYLFQMAGDIRIKKIIIDGLKFFLHEPALLLMEQQMIIIGDLEKDLVHAKSIDDLRIIKKEDYFDFQNTLRRAVGEKEVEPYNPNENPKVKYFKAKARLRDRVKAKSKDSLTLGSTLASICCMGLGITPLNVGELSQAAIAIIIRTYQEKDKYDIDIQSLLAGADSKKVKPQFWIRNIEDL